MTADPDQPAPAWADLPAYRAAYRKRCPVPGWALPALAELRQWVLWRYEPGETPEKKPRKMPYYPGGGKRAGDQGSERDRRRLGTFAEATAKARAGDWDGVGFAFLPGDGLLGIDLDGVIDPATGEQSERMQAICSACASYAEFSPSGTGVHIICRLPDDLAQRWEAEGRRLTFKSNKVGVEVFHGRQFFTWTGDRYGDEDLAPIDETVFRRLYATVEAARKPAKPSTPPAASPPPQQQPLGGKQRSLAETVALAEEAIGFVDPGEYQIWIDIGMACKAGLGAAGYLVWDAWSARSPKYAGPEDTAKRWAGFNPEQIGIGSLFALAEQGGWVSPWEKAKARKSRSKPAAASMPPPNDAPPPFDDMPPDATQAPAGAPAGPPPDEAWERRLLYKKGDVSACLANAELVLSHMPEWDGVIGYDLFAERTVFRKRLPFDIGAGDSGEWTDHLDTTSAIHLQRAWQVEFSPTTVGQAVEVLARRHRFHPVRDALAALPSWDGIRRNPKWLSDFLGVEQTEYTARVGTFFLRGMIKRVMEPGCKFDYCLVLEGEQGRGKSTVARILSWHWFCDTDLDLSNKDSLMALPGHWVYEIAELGSLMKAEERKQKSFLSRQEDEYRPPYGKRLIKAPRQSVFIGTTNEDEYLKDATGGRRFWPVKVGEEIDLEGLRNCLELMLAEALHDYHQGERCWPTRAEQDELFTPEQAKRGMPEPFDDFLYKFVQDQVTRFSMKDVAEHLNLTPDKLTPSITTRIGITLKKLGCVREEHRTAVDPSQRRLFVPPALQKQSKTSATPEPARDSDGNGEEYPRAPF
jgi:hypothetical protein